MSDRVRLGVVAAPCALIVLAVANISGRGDKLHCLGRHVEQHS